MIKHKTRVQEIATNKPNAATAFNLPTSAGTGFRTFAAAYANTDLLPYLATDGTAWESGIGTFTTGGTNTLVRTTILESSNSNAAVDFSGSASFPTIFVEMSADIGQMLNIAQAGVSPGGRLTLTSGTPVTTSDVTSATTIYYTPAVHNIIVLWNGTMWQPIEFDEASLAVGTVTASLPYDVFAYLNAGVIALEKLAWSSITARATAVTLQDGRYCKSGDKTRLYLGTILPKTTTTVDDSGVWAGVWNLYNQVFRKRLSSPGGSMTITTTPAIFNNGTTKCRIDYVAGLSCEAILAYSFGGNTGSTTNVQVRSGVGNDTESAISTTTYDMVLPSTSSFARVTGSSNEVLSAGAHYMSLCCFIASGSNTASTSSPSLLPSIKS